MSYKTKIDLFRKLRIDFYSKDQLKNLVQWKMLGQGAYVLGIEPANCHVEGRAAERARDTLEFLQPGEKRQFHLKMGVLASEDEIRECKARIEELTRRSSWRRRSGRENQKQTS